MKLFKDCPICDSGEYIGIAAVKVSYYSEPAEIVSCRTCGLATRPLIYNKIHEHWNALVDKIIARQSSNGRPSEGTEETRVETPLAEHIKPCPFCSSDFNFWESDPSMGFAQHPPHKICPLSEMEFSATTAEQMNLRP